MDPVLPVHMFIENTLVRFYSCAAQYRSAGRQPMGLVVSLSQADKAHTFCLQHCVFTALKIFSTFEGGGGESVSLILEERGDAHPKGHCLLVPSCRGPRVGKFLLLL